MTDNCVICWGSNLRTVYEFPDQPLANGLLKSAADRAETYPLHLAQCDACDHVQLAAISRVEPDGMFSVYPYRTGASATMRRHFGDLARGLAAKLTPGAVVVDVGCNDCTFLRALREIRPDVRAVGVDPSDVASGCEGVINDYLTARTVDCIRAVGEAEVVLIANCLAHTQDPMSLLRNAAKLLAPGGEIIVEVPDLDRLIDDLSYGQVYHEHVSYFGLGALYALADECGLDLTRKLDMPTHLGSMRVHFSRCPTPSELVALRDWDVTWERFRDEMEWHVALMREMTVSATAVYGLTCPAKAVPIIHATGIRPIAISDIDPGKQGMFLPVAGGPPIPIVHPDSLMRRAAHMVSSVGRERVRCVAFAHNLRDEIIESYDAAGLRGTILIPSREPEVI